MTLQNLGPASVATEGKARSSDPLSSEIDFEDNVSAAAVKSEHLAGRAA
jgi:hypothetical protein